MWLWWGNEAIGLAGNQGMVWQESKLWYGREPSYDVARKQAMVWQRITLWLAGNQAMVCQETRL